MKQFDTSKITEALNEKQIEEAKEVKKSTEDLSYDRLEKIQVSPNIEENLHILEEVFKNNNRGIIKRCVTLGKTNIEAVLIFVDGMINKEELEHSIVKPMVNASDLQEETITMDYAKEKLLYACRVEEAQSFDEVIYELLSGNTLVFIDGCSSALVVGNREAKGRSVEKPDTEQNIRGGKEAFVEDIDTNFVLVRKRIKSPDLQIDVLKVGKRTRQSIAVLYIKGIINPQIPKEIMEEISKIDIDGVLGNGQIEHLIQKEKWSFFPQMFPTERVDRVVGALIEGRAVVMLDGTPFCLIIPSTFAMFLNSTDDYQERPFITTLLRIVRYFGFYMATSVSALYLAITTYQPALLPTSLTLSITGTRVGLPFPVFVEIIIMEITLYLIQEAAIRLPKAVGQTVGIVGGLVIGQAVVQAGIVSPIIVIIVALSAISSYTMPNYSFSVATIVIRLILILCSAFLGLYGFVLGSMAILIHGASIENYGVKYMEDLSPYNKENLKDTFIIGAQHTVKKRPSYLDTVDTIRQKFKLRKGKHE